MIIYEYNKINHEPYLRITSDQENHYVKIKNTENDPTNEIMIPGDSTDLEFEEIYVEPLVEESPTEEEPLENI